MPSFQETSSGVGKVQLILGPMFSGKSTELIRRLKRYQVGFGISIKNCRVIMFSSRFLSEGRIIFFCKELHLGCKVRSADYQICQGCEVGDIFKKLLCFKKDQQM